MISVLVVDDSVVVRRLVTDALAGAPGITVVGTAANGRLAQAKIDQLRPDVVTMDIEMPEMDGITAVRELRKRHRWLPVIMFSTLSVAGAAATLDALAAGATDYVTKPANVGSVKAAIEAVREQLVPRIHALGRRPGGARVRSVPPPSPLTRGATGAPPARPGTAAPTSTPRRSAPPPSSLTRPGGPGLAAAGALLGSGRVDVVAVGCSTGGPDALAHVLAGLSGDLPVPMVVVQHMPPLFTQMFAERLNRSCPLEVLEAGPDLVLRPGTVYIAPGDRHLEVVRRGTDVVTRLTSDAPENSCRPAADVLFRSVARIYGRATLAVVLTGMGQDGLRGCEPLRAAGAKVVVQDEATSVVWGMPGAVVGAGLADAVLPLSDIASVVAARANAGRLVRRPAVTQ